MEVILCTYVFLLYLVRDRAGVYVNMTRLYLFIYVCVYLFIN